MSILATIVASTSSQVAQVQPGVQSQRFDSATQGANAAQSPVVLGQAAVVNISASSSSRLASHGAGKMVDASFDDQIIKEEGKESKEKGKDEKKTGKVDVTA